MTKQHLLVENISALTKTNGNRWKVVIAVPGKGNTGLYEADMLREYGPQAFPAGTKAWIGHTTPQNRDSRDQFGRYGAAYYDDAYDPEKYPEGALVSDVEVFKHYVEMIEEIGEDAELSMSVIDYDIDPDGRVTAMYPHRANSVDLVAYGGLEGSGLRERLQESFKISEVDSEGKPSGETSAQDRKEGNVEKELIEALAKINARLDALDAKASAEVTDKAKAEAEAQVEVDVAAKVDEALSAYEGQVAAIDAAELGVPAMVESLKAEARKGVDVAPLIESYKATVDAVKKSLEPAPLTESFVGGVRINEGASKDDDFTVGGL